jgi:hypothetical protein
MTFQNISIGDHFIFLYDNSGIAPGISPPGSIISHAPDQSEMCIKLSATTYRVGHDPYLTTHHCDADAVVNSIEEVS